MVGKNAAACISDKHRDLSRFDVLFVDALCSGSYTRAALFRGSV